MKKSVNGAVGERIYALRIAQNMSQRQLAHATRIHRDSIRDWELNKSFPSLNALILLAQFFEIPSDHILGICPKSWIYIGNLTDRQELIIRNLMNEFERESG